MKKNPHIIWVCPNSQSFYRAKGEVRCRLGSVIPKLAEQGIRLNVLIPHDPTLLPKTKLSSTRVTSHVVRLAQDYPVEIIKLTRGTVSPGVYMVKTPSLEPALSSAVFAKSALALAHQLKRPVDIFHLFDWESALLPLFLELEKNGHRLFKDTRTFLNVSSLKEQGNFAPAILAYLGIPSNLFHPEGIEFYGKVSFLKSGLLFSDGVGLVENGTTSRAFNRRNGTGLEGLLDALISKLRRWASERSVRSHLEAYQELLSVPKGKPLLPKLLEKLHTTTTEAEKFIESWGPVPPERYGINTLSFLLQSPVKAFAFWEWTGHDHSDYGVVLEDRTAGSKKILSRGVGTTADYWVEVAPDREYVMELVGWTREGKMQPLLRSQPLRTPRKQPSSNTNAVFLDVRSRKRYTLSALALWDELVRRLRLGEGTSAWEWVIPRITESIQGLPTSGLPSSLSSSGSRREETLT